MAAYVGWMLLRWLWDYITPKYEQPEEEESAADQKRKDKKERKEKVKYIKKWYLLLHNKN